MNEFGLAKVSEKIQDYIVSADSNTRGGVQIVFRFENNLGASVINHNGSYGVELAVAKFNSEDNDDWDICYTTPITSDVIGYIETEDELISLLNSIKNLEN